MSSLNNTVDLSVIIPLYKGKTFIEQTVLSIREIKCSKEIIIVDDGSPDDSYDFCTKQFCDFEEVSIIQKKNGGIVDARNFGLSKATGRYVMFSDQDDICFAETIQKAVKLAMEQNIDMVYWSTVCLLENGEYTSRDIVSNDVIISEEEVRSVMIPDMLTNTENRYISYIGHVWSALFKREVIKKKDIKFKRFVDIEDDYLFLLDFMLSVEKVAFITNVGYAWRFNRKSETYRIKHIKEFVDKYVYFHNYILDSVDFIGLNEEKIKQFNIYMNQEMVIRAIENSFTYLVNSKEEKKQVRNLYKDLKKYFRMKSVAPYNKRRKRIFMLLSLNLFSLAGFYVYLDSFYRKIKRVRN